MKRTMISTGQAAELLGLSRKRVVEMVDAGIFAAVDVLRVGKGHRRIDEEAVLRLMYGSSSAQSAERALAEISALFVEVSGTLSRAGVDQPAIQRMGDAINEITLAVRRRRTRGEHPDWT